MQTFLKLIARQLIENHKTELGNIAVVLPNKRANIFLRDELSSQIENTTWAPSIYSLEDFVEEMVKLTTIDQIDLIFELYEVHKNVEGEKAESFDEFMNWGAILLYDFNEIDRYMVDAKELYGFLSEARAIETWNPETGRLTEFQEKYLKFWDKLHTYYQQFRTRLIEKGLSYQGLSFRYAAENITKSKAFSHYNKIYFAGFNALTEAEKVLLNHFKEHKGAELIFDADSYYLDNKFQESGRFLREHQNNHSPFNWKFEYFKDQAKEIDIYGISGNIGQSKLVGDILLKNESHFSNEKTAVVLSDENLLVPILDSLPSTAEKVNVTMGYALSNTIFYDFFDKYLSLYYKTNEEDKPNEFYYKDVLELLNHPTWNILKDGVKSKIQSIKKQIEELKVFFIALDLLEPINEQLELSFFIPSKSNSAELLKNILCFCENFIQNTDIQLSPLNSEILYSFYACFNRMNQIIEKANVNIEIKGIYQLYKQVVSGQSVSFIGEPLLGLQVMGVLETRTLDFEHVIMTSVNEGVLPSGKTQSTFIPYDIKRKFNLPSYKEKDSIFAYHFYRLLQRAKKVSLIYNTFNDGLNAGEKSRFILQIQKELAIYNPQIKIKEHIVSEKPNPSKAREVIIKNNKDIQSQITLHLKDGISPSAINSFLLCPLNYYYKYILGLREEDIATEELALNSFGNIVHLTLENLYKEHLNQKLNSQSITRLYSNFEAETFKAFEKETNQKPITGNYKLAFEIAKIYVKKIIDLDHQEVKLGNELFIINVEQKFEKEIKLDHPIGSIKLKGKIDRVDIINGKKRIIDYKTGGVESRELKLTTNNADKIIEGKYSKLLQMIVYWLALYQENEELDIGILSTKNETTQFMPLSLDKKLEAATPDKEILFCQIIEEVVLAMTSNDLEFKHNPDSKFCDFCQ